MSSKITGMFVTFLDNGSTQSDKVKRFDTYQEMLDDTSAVAYGIVDNTVYRREASGWVVGFKNIEQANDYSAFEVFPTSTQLEPGQYTNSGYANQVAIVPSDAHHLIIRSIHQLSDQDVIIDWGDGTITDIKTDSEVKVYGTRGSWDFVVRHKYQELDKHYIVKIFGHTYFGFMSESSSKFIDDGSGDPKCYLNHNLISRIFDKDLPIASCVSNAASMCKYARRLLAVNVYGHEIVRQVTNWTLCFSGCTNLYTAWGFQDDNLNVSACSEIFNNCKSMVQTDFKIPRAPRSSSTATAIYKECNNLSSQVTDLLETTDFFVSPYKIGSMFYNTKVVITADTVDKIAAKLWNNPNIEFTSTSSAFKGCPDETRAFVPKAWGGTAE